MPEETLFLGSHRYQIDSFNQAEGGGCHGNR